MILGLWCLNEHRSMLIEVKTCDNLAQELKHAMADVQCHLDKWPQCPLAICCNSNAKQDREQQSNLECVTLCTDAWQ